MADITSRVVNVIQTTLGGTLIYYTLEGLEIGRVVDGKAVSPEPTKLVSEVPKSGVVTADSPKEVSRKRQKQVDREMILEERLEYEKEQNT